MSKSIWIEDEEYELASYGDRYSDGSRQATIRLKNTSESVEFNIKTVKRWIKNRSANYGNNETLDALRLQVKKWQNWVEEQDG